MSWHGGYVYTLADPVTREVRYVGVSGNPEARVRRHIWQATTRSQSRRRDAMGRWLAAMIRAGRRPIVRIEPRIEKSERYFVERYRRRGCRLFNIKPGVDKVRP